MKRLLPFLAALLVLLVRCNPITSLSAPGSLVVTVTDNGGTLQVSWAAVTSATGYNIYYDGHTTKDTSITGTQISISTPHTTIDITATNGSTESGKATVDATPVVTSSVTAYFTSATSWHTNGIGFAGDGSCIAIDLSQQTNWSSVNFVLEDTVTVSGSTVPGFWSPDAYGAPYNSQDNAIAPSTGTDFNALSIDPAPGTYQTRQAITQNAVYPLWISTSSTGWSSNDHFAKAYITQVGTDGTVQLEVAFQKNISGLRWLVTQ
jgi:hypothetical protein